MRVNKEETALIVIDVQNDFCPGGALEVKEGDKIVPVINEVMGYFSWIVATQDWHPADHLSFASNHSGKKPLEVINVDGIDQVLWPDHCIQGSKGAEFHPELNASAFSLILRKGRNKRIDSYSAFYENDKKTKTGLIGFLHELGIGTLFFCGLAIDYCVYYSVMDALGAGFKCYVIEDAVRGVDFPVGSVDRAVNDMKTRGAIFISSEELKD